MRLCYYVLERIKNKKMNLNIPTTTVAPQDQTEAETNQEQSNEMTTLHETQSQYVDGLMLERAQDRLSALLHGEWRKELQAGFVRNGQEANTERLRPSKDKTGEADVAWFAAQEANGTQFPIDDAGNKLVNTNAAYEDLPPSWQQANIGAARFVTEYVADSINTGAHMGEEYVEQAASAVHDNWMRDNEWDKENRPELFVPYGDLTEDEKQKDRAQVFTAMQEFTRFND